MQSEQIRTREDLTIGQLMEFCQTYLRDHPEGVNDKCVVCDDGMKPRYFDIKFPAITKVARVEVPEKVEMRNINGKDCPFQIEPPKYRYDDSLVFITSMTEEI